jgi:hypothetical protein
MSRYETVETPRKDQTIERLLPRYIEANDNDTTYEVIELYTIDGHEVAWIESTGSMKFDLSGQKREEAAYKLRGLHCACHFTEAVGWRIDQQRNQIVELSYTRCNAEQIVVDQKIEQLHKGYIASGAIGLPEAITITQIKFVMKDLVTRITAGEFLESSNGAAFWGGYYYLQTLAAATGVTMQQLWPFVHTLISEKQLSLEGMVAQPYREPPEPRWELYTTERIGDWIGTVLLPVYRSMAQQWKFEITGPTGNTYDVSEPPLPIYHSPDFGVDVEDDSNARNFLKSALIRATQQKHMEQNK